jgi:hypothetical protein
MFKMLSIISVLVFASVSYGQNFKERWDSGNDTFRLLLGSSAAATNVGIDYERRMGASGLGAFLHQSKKRDVTTTLTGKPEQWALGVTTPIHLTDRSNFDVYLAPGLTVLQTKDVKPDNKDITSFGPTLKIGTMYYFNNQWSAGLDFMTLTNYFSDQVAGSESYANLALGYTF